MFFSEEIDRTLIETYFGRYSEALFAGSWCTRALADVKWSTWAMVQNRISDLDFDFYKYGIWKHMRARSIMNDTAGPPS